MPHPDEKKWNERYRAGGDSSVSPATVVQDNLALLPKGGRALDLAAGLGGNAMLLARQGLDVHAWDISGVAMERLRDSATSLRLAINCQQRDVMLSPPEPESFDLIVVSRFLKRELCPSLATALRPGGLLFYQTFTIDSREGPSNPAFLLQRNELLHLFSTLQIILYREEGIVSAQHHEAMLIARRP